MNTRKNHRKVAAVLRAISRASVDPRCLLIRLGVNNGLKMPTVSADGGADGPVPGVRRAPLDPAAQAVTLRVRKVANQLIESNESIGLRPVFLTLGAPTPEIFHRGGSQVMLTDGLVNRCD